MMYHSMMGRNRNVKIIAVRRAHIPNVTRYFFQMFGSSVRTVLSTASFTVEDHC